MLTSRMASKRKSTPEYEVLREYLHRICDALSQLPDSITPLARDFCASGIISSAIMSSASNTAEAPYYRANAIMTAAHVSVQQDPRKFDAVLEKLSDQELNGLAKEMSDKLDNHGKIATAVQAQDVRSITPASEKYKPVCKRNLKIKRQMKILVVGHNGSGKSSLINEMLGGMKVATVGRPDEQTPHDSIEEYECKVGDVDVTIFDTRGFGDPSVTDKTIMESIVKIKTVDVVFICHRLYDRVDDATVKELNVLIDSMGNDLMDLSVLVFTYGDDYLSRCDPIFDNSGKLTDESKKNIKEAMETQHCQMDYKLKDTIKKNGINKKVADRIPSCISCGKRKGNGEIKELPTSDNWVDDLWDLCEQRCKPEARPFVQSMRGTIISTVIAGVVGGGIGAVAGVSVATGVKAGATIGSAAAPVIGTVGGAVVGGVVGGLYGTTSAAGASVAGAVIGAGVQSVVKK